MADNVQITAGSGTPIGTDDEGGVHYQKVKLADGTSGQTTAIAAGEGLKANALRVTLATDDEANNFLGTIDADTSSLAGCVGGTELQVDVVSSALPTGAALEAGGNLAACATSLGNMDNAVDGNYLNVNLNAAGTDVATNAGTLNAQTLRVTIATDDECNNFLGAMDADTSALAGCVGGTELQVDIVAALPAGTNGIGKLTANSGVDIGDVDVTSVIPGVAATNLGKAEDAAHTSGDTGVYVLAVRDDALAAHSGTDGDYESLHTNAVGALYVDPVPGAMWSANEDETGAVTDDALVAAPGASLCLYVTDIMVTNDATAAITIKFIEDTASAKTNKTGTHKVPASGGFVLNLRTPIKCTANKDFGYTSTGTSNYSVFVAGYTAA